MKETIIGLIVLIIIFGYFLFLAMKMILEGIRKMKDDQTEYGKINSLIIRGVIVCGVSLPFLFYILHIIIMAFN